MLLLDEPLGALDARTRTAMQALLVDAVERFGCSVLLVTHDVREAILVSDRIVLLSARPGRIIGRYAVPGSRPRASVRRLPMRRAFRSDDRETNADRSNDADFHTMPSVVAD